MNVAERIKADADSMSTRTNFERLVFAVLLALVAALFIAVSLPFLDKPGLYMDAVDPDYLVVRMLHPDAPDEIWMMPGNMLFGRWPVMAGPYSGSFVAYLLVPFYAVLGGTLDAIRIAHVFIGLAIVIAVFVLVRRATQSVAIAVMTSGLLAVDPAFVLIFRTQAYISIFPCIPALAGFTVLLNKPQRWRYVAAGVLFGLAAYGYFIFGFLMPGLIAFCLLDSSRGERARLCTQLVSGFILGASPYVLGYGMVFASLGFDGAINFLSTQAFALKINTGQSWVDRFLSICSESWQMLTGAWAPITFWGDATIHRGQAIKVGLLLLLPLAALRPAWLHRGASRGFFICTFSAVSYFATATIFGQRLGGHDLTPLLPLVYVSSGAALGVLQKSGLRSRPIALLSAAMFVILLVTSLKVTNALTWRLGQESANGLFSSIFSDYPKEAEARNDKTPHIFWQWGSLFQFIYLTEGRIPAASSGGLHAALCSYGSAKIVLTGDETVRHPDLDYAKLGVFVRNAELRHDRYSGYPYEIVTVTPRPRSC